MVVKVVDWMLVFLVILGWGEWRVLFEGGGWMNWFIGGCLVEDDLGWFVLLGF